MSGHKVTLKWERGGAEFSYQKYPRDHTWSFDGGHTMTATAAPAYLGSVVASGTSHFFYAVNPDCSASGDVNIRVTKQPEHGTVETITATNFPAFPKENIRARCNNHKVRGVQVNYKSAEKYVGDDTLDLLVLFPGGFGGEVHLNINVR
jgi:hypothetical protein